MISKRKLRKLLRRAYPNIQISDESLEMLELIIEYDVILLMDKVVSLMRMGNKARLTRKLFKDILYAMGIDIEQITTMHKT